jgi:hypothetical protein
VLEHSSELLKGNPLGDPHVGKLAVWLPPQYARRARARQALPDTHGHGRIHGLRAFPYRLESLQQVIRGYGAIMHGMKYASTWGAIADHSGDAAGIARD